MNDITHDKNGKPLTDPDEVFRLDCLRLAMQTGVGREALTHVADGFYDYVKNGRQEQAEETSNLVRHARRELELIGEDPWIADHIVNVVRAFADAGHSGGSAAAVIPMLMELLQFKPLSPITNDPDEWMHIAEEQAGEPGGIWQNVRDGEAFSSDGGKHYWLLRDGASSKRRSPLYVAADPVATNGR
jgi:hypothetical protein